MIGNLIIAYKVKFGRHFFSDLNKMRKEQPKIFYIGITMFLSSIGSFYLSVVHGLISPMMISMMIGIILYHISGKHDEKKYISYIDERQQYLGKVVEFLETTIPDNNLFNNEKIEQIIVGMKIEQENGMIFKDLGGKSWRFFSVMVVPVLAFVGGVFSADLKSFGAEFILRNAMVVLLELFLLYISFSNIVTPLKSILCWNYRTIARFTYDLRDIQLLYFNNDEVIETPDIEKTIPAKCYFKT